MLNDLVFSLNAVMPLFLIIVLGYVLKKKNFLSDGFVTSGNKLIFYIALPTTLFRNILSTGIEELLDWPFIAFVVGMSTLSFILIWFIAAYIIKDKKMLGAFVQGSFRGNFAFLGMPLLFNLSGEAGMARAALIITFVLPLFNIFSVLVLSTCSNSSQRVGYKTVFFTILKNPLIIGIFIAFIFMVLNIRPPFMLERVTFYTSNMATPIALICLGAGIKFYGFDIRFKYAFAASIIKVLVLPIVFITIGYLLGFRGDDIAAILVLGGIPSAIVGYTMVIQMGGDAYIASTIVVISTIMSAFTLTVFVYLLQIFGV